MRTLLVASCLVACMPPDHAPSPSTVGAAPPARCGPSAVAWVMGSGQSSSTVQDAIDAAPPGGVVAICPGTHTELLELPAYADIELRGATGSPQDVVLDGELQHAILQPGSDRLHKVVLRFLTFRRGSDVVNAETAVSLRGRYDSWSQVLVDRCVFEDNEGPASCTALDVEANQIDVRGTIFRRNHGCVANLTTIGIDSFLHLADTAFVDTVDAASTLLVGPEFTSVGSTTILLDRVLVRDNSGVSGSGLDVNPKFDTDIRLGIRDSEFLNNESSGAGAAVRLNVPSGSTYDVGILRTIFADNYGEEGIFGLWDPVIALTHRVRMRHVQFLRNTVPTAVGWTGGWPVYTADSASTELYDVDFGTGVDDNSADLEIHSCPDPVGYVTSAVIYSPGAPYCP